MDAKIINAFLTEGMNTFEAMFGIKATPKEAHLLEVHAGHPWEVSGLLGITGMYKGIIAFRLHKILASKMLELSGIACRPEDFDDMALELVSEFTNIISGHAVSVIKNCELEISPPLTVIGQNHQISWPKSYPIIAIPFVTKFGPFEVDVCFK